MHYYWLLQLLMLDFHFYLVLFIINFYLETCYIVSNSFVGQGEGIFQMYFCYWFLVYFVVRENHFVFNSFEFEGCFMAHNMVSLHLLLGEMWIVEWTVFVHQNREISVLFFLRFEVHIVVVLIYPSIDLKKSKFTFSCFHG